MDPHHARHFSKATTSFFMTGGGGDIGGGGGEAGSTTTKILNNVWFCCLYCCESGEEEETEDVEGVKPPPQHAGETLMTRTWRTSKTIFGFTSQRGYTPQKKMSLKLCNEAIEHLCEVLFSIKEGVDLVSAEDTFTFA